MDYLKIGNQNNLVRNLNNNSILNIDKNEYQNYISLKNKKDLQFERLNNIETDLVQIKNEILNIKNSLEKIINESR